MKLAASKHETPTAASYRRQRRRLTRSQVFKLNQQQVIEEKDGDISCRQWQEKMEANGMNHTRSRRFRRITSLPTANEINTTLESNNRTEIFVVGKQESSNEKKTTSQKCQPNMLTATTLLLTTLLLATCYDFAVAAVTTTAAAEITNSNEEPQMVELVRVKAGNSIPAARVRRSPLAHANSRTANFGADTAAGLPSPHPPSQPARPRGSSSSSLGSRQQPQLVPQQQQQQQAAESTMDLAPVPGTTLSRPPTAIRNVTAQNGQSVLLHCLVEPSSDLAVSWFRGTGELQLLTYESNTIIQDERFVVRHGLVKDDDWALQIKNLDKTTDSGLYQCQTNSEPPQSQYYQLNIVEPQVHILGAPDMAVKLGAAINLTCVISQSPDQLQFVFWYRDERMINYDISAEIGKIVMSKWAQKQDTITSNLQIFNSKLTDSGNYTCMPSGARPQSIYVHVLEGLDKQLIMFQNDFDPSAASSQQTNSAISVHIVRLSRGRVYAFFVAFIIFSSWFQLVAQTQTAISLLLLAIIGLFLGKVTDSSGSSGGARFDSRRRSSSSSTYLHSNEENEYQEKKCNKVEKFHKIQSVLGGDFNAKTTGKSNRKQDKSDDDDSGAKQRWQRESSRESRSSPNISSSSGNSRVSDDNDSESASNDTIDPLIRRANSAINQLKSLSSITGSSSDVESSPDDDAAGAAHFANKQTTSAASSKRRTRQQQYHQKKQMRTMPTATTPTANVTKQAKLRSERLLRLGLKGLESQAKSSELLVVVKPLTSPSASSASTGYNSDTATHSSQRRHNYTVQSCSSSNTLLVAHTNKKRNIIGDQNTCRSMISSERADTLVSHDANTTDEMIELVEQPTALDLIMDEFSQQRATLAATNSTITLAAAAATTGALSTTPTLTQSQVSHITPVKPPRLEQLKLVERLEMLRSPQEVRLRGQQFDKQPEPYYSSPVPTKIEEEISYYQEQRHLKHGDRSSSQNVKLNHKTFN